ncbi:MAG TPA: hypothetical protein VFF04_01935 [Candidatus Babeliales bacterium]|nr:hypothetical protein [Candidatus Babeliales bacterium]
MQNKYYSKIAFAAICFASSCQASVSLSNMLDEIMNDMQEHMMQMKKDIKHMHEELTAQQLEQAAIAIQEDTQKRQVIIAVNNVDLDTVDATIYEDDNRLTVKAPQATIQIAVKDALINVDLTQNTQRTVETKNGQSQFFSTSSSSKGQFLNNKIALTPETINIAYDKNDKVLNIVLQTATLEDKAKKIPVTITNNSAMAANNVANAIDTNAMIIANNTSGTAPETAEIKG